MQWIGRRGAVENELGTVTIRGRTMPVPDFSLSERVALLTGAGRGIGLGIAQAFASTGCAVAIQDIDRDIAESEADWEQWVQSQPVCGMPPSWAMPRTTTRGAVDGAAARAKAARRRTGARRRRLMGLF